MAPSKASAALLLTVRTDIMLSRDQISYWDLPHMIFIWPTPTVLSWSLSDNGSRLVVSVLIIVSLNLLRDSSYSLHLTICLWQISTVYLHVLSLFAWPPFCSIHETTFGWFTSTITNDSLVPPWHLARYHSYSTPLIHTTPSYGSSTCFTIPYLHE